MQFPSKLHLGNKVSYHDAGRNRPRNGTEEDKRRGRIGVFWLGWEGGNGSGFEMGDGCERRDVKGGKRDPTFRNGFL